MKFKRTKLDNGVCIITVPMKDTQTATVVVMVGVGSRYESEKEAGISHFIEHMMFKGTEKRPSFADINSELDSIGGEHNAFTSKDTTGYYAKVNSRHLDLAIDLIADIYLNSKIDEKEIEKERGAIIQELNMYEDRPMRKVEEVLDALLYQGNPLGREIIGYKETIQALKRDDLVKFKRRHYLADETVICVAGNFEEESTIDLLKKYFSAMEGGEKPVFSKIEEDQKYPAVNIKFKKTDQTHFVIGSRGYHENHPDRFALAILTTILGGNSSSRLFAEIREKRGLAYFVRTGADDFADCGYVATQASVGHDKLESAIEVILKEYKRITSEKVSERELRCAKEYIKGISVMNLESSDEVAMFHIDQEMKRKKIMTLKELLENFEKVTRDDILRVAQDVLKENTLNLAVIGPQEDEKKLQSLLKI
ncbi:MAG TPA: hypothetical protein DIT25_04730 [Candidatus Moranbacteria bacterium]|nr:hypothetical protein [Candidatus Moranbacteria bacterium]